MPARGASVNVIELPVYFLCVSFSLFNLQCAVQKYQEIITFGNTCVDPPDNVVNSVSPPSNVVSATLFGKNGLCKCLSNFPLSFQY
ncbi:MAG: hypothetical protein CM15mV8_2330 [Caudoviricetes sp.]|nr:MAG: hypothetical protein CM15mV8_2330 [Caudoviricetes sp.]